MGYCSDRGEDRKCNTLFAWLQIECINCNETQSFRDYHVTYRIPFTDMNGKKRKSRVELYCSKCKKIMELESFNLKKIEDEE